MRSVEASAKTRKEAIEKALVQIGAEMHEVDIEILDEGSRGIFGFGARDVRVRVSAQHLPDFPKKTERREERKPQENQRPHQANRPASSEARPVQENRPPRDQKNRQEDRSKHPEGARPAQGQPRGEKKGTPRQENRPKREDQRTRTGTSPQQTPRPERVPRPEQAAPQHAPKPERRENVPPAPKPEEKPVVPISDARREELTALLAELIRLMGIEATVTSNATEDGGAILSVESKDSAILIGRKGRTLQALQYLINRMSTETDASETTERIVVDIESYLDRRKSNLEDMALQLAAKAKETGRDVRVKPLSSQERRIIHLTLQDDPGVRTFSLGTGAIRNVIISPKTQSEKGEPGDNAPAGERRSGNRPHSARRGRRYHGRNPRQNANPEADSGSNPAEASDGATES